MARALRSLAGRRLLAVDPGATFTGLAVRASGLAGARPYGLVERVQRRRQRPGSSTPTDATSGDAAWEVRRVGGGGGSRHASLSLALAAVMDEQRVDAVVFGMPFHADGSRSPQCDMVERQVAGLQAEWGAQSVPVLLWDESFSTRRAVGSPYRARGKASVAAHAAAAAIVLEEVLHALQPLESELADEGWPSEPG